MIPDMIASKPMRQKIGAVLFDLAAGGAAMVGAIALRAEPQPEAWTYALVASSFMACVALAFGRLNIWSTFWRHASLGDILDVARAVAIANLIFVPAWFLVTRLDGLPRTSLLLEPVAFLALSGGARLFVRWLKTHRLSFNRVPAGRRSTILVAGDVDHIGPFIRTVQSDPHSSLRIAGALDTAGAPRGLRVRGVPLLGGPADTARAIAELEAEGEEIDALILVGGGVERGAASAIVAGAAERCVRVAKAQMPEDLLKVGHGEAPTPLHLADLLGRPPRRLDPEPVRRLIRDKRILVTGAGGSIGSALIREILTFEPSALILADHSEASLYAVDLEARERGGAAALYPLVADIRDRDGLREAFERHRPHAVFHAAALKHVPLMETQPREAVITNIQGTIHAADAADEFGAQAFVLVSTDKAVRPANVMGATKRAAELYVQAMDAKGGTTRFRAVRFGNVLGSAGSVVPLFERQLARGGPLTVTHPDMRRYFMTAEEAAALTLQAAADDSAQAAPGGVNVLDMGEPVRILDLAHQMIRLHGKRPGRDVEIVFTGLRPGERLMEELAWGVDEPKPTGVDGLLRSHPPFRPLRDIEPALRRIVALARAHMDPTADLFALIGDAFDAESSAASRREGKVVVLPQRG